MRRFIAWLLLCASLLGLTGCGAAPTPTENPEISTETTALAVESVPTETTAPAVESVPTETTAPESETAPTAEGSLFLKVSSITFSLVGETDDIYLGLVPRDQITWESDDPEIIRVENGVLTAVGVGSTIIRAFCGDREVTCTASCLAATQEELVALDHAILQEPKRLPPEVDLEEPCSSFENAALIGDSITYFLWQSESQNNYLGDVLFITRQGISINGLVNRFKNIYFRGHEMNIEDIVAQCGAERIYILLGCLDYQVDAAREMLMENWKVMLDRIRAESPDVEIVIISNIPEYTVLKIPTEYNTAVAETNVKLRQLAAEEGCGFLDLGYYVEDHYGRMAAVYSKDDYHLNSDGSLLWMKILRYFARFEQEGGALS